jgi:hypothetical protein
MKPDNCRGFNSCPASLQFDDLLGFQEPLGLRHDRRGVGNSAWLLPPHQKLPSFSMTGAGRRRSWTIRN